MLNEWPLGPDPAPVKNAADRMEPGVGLGVGFVGLGWVWGAARLPSRWRRRGGETQAPKRTQHHQQDRDNRVVRNGHRGRERGGHGDGCVWRFGGFGHKLGANEQSKTNPGCEKEKEKTLAEVHSIQTRAWTANGRYTRVCCCLWLCGLCFVQGEGRAKPCSASPPSARGGRLDGHPSAHLGLGGRDM